LYTLAGLQRKTKKEEEGELTMLEVGTVVSSNALSDDDDDDDDDDDLKKGERKEGIGMLETIIFKWILKHRTRECGLDSSG
jgi:hypothetical protein